MSNKQRTDTRDEDDDDQYRDPEDKWEGFHFTRVTAVSILTFIIYIAALILDNLSVFGKERECTYYECIQNLCVCGSRDGEDYEYYPTCQANGQCGWRTGKTSWIRPNPSSPNCPYCNDAVTDTCITDSVETSTPSNPDAWQISIQTWDSEYNYAVLCRAGDDEACMAFDGGNTYMVFTVAAIIFNIFTLCLIAPLYCREKAIFPCDICNEKTHIFLGILYGCTFVCNFIPVVVWLGAAKGGMCDNADPNHNIAFVDDTVNWPGYSTGGLIIAMVANLVVCFCVCFCWGDNRHYNDEMDQAKIDRAQEKEMYRQQEMQETNQQQQQSFNPAQQNQYDPNQNNGGYGQPQNNQGYGQQPQYNNNQGYGAQPQYNQGYNGGQPQNTTYSYN